MRDKGALEQAQRETSEFYDRIPFRSPLRRGQKRNRFFRDIPSGRRILDVGSGSGRTSALLRSRHPESHIICLDISRVSLSRLDSFSSKVNASALSLPFGPGTFDLVVSVGCLHHTPDARAGFVECVRVLREGGGLLVALFNRWNLYPLIYAAAQTLPHFARRCLRHPLIQDQLFSPHVSFHSPPEVKRWFREKSLRLVKYASTGYLPPYLVRDWGQFVYYYGRKSGHEHLHRRSEAVN